MLILDCRSHKALFNLSLHGFQTKDSCVKSIRGIVKKILQLHALSVYPHEMQHLQYSFYYQLGSFSSQRRLRGMHMMNIYTFQETVCGCVSSKKSTFHALKSILALIHCQRSQLCISGHVLRITPSSSFFPSWHEVPEAVYDRTSQSQDVSCAILNKAWLGKRRKAINASKKHKQHTKSCTETNNNMRVLFFNKQNIRDDFSHKSFYLSNKRAVYMLAMAVLLCTLRFN